MALALLTLPTVFDQPNLGADATILENTKVLDAELTSPDVISEHQRVTRQQRGPCHRVGASGLRTILTQSNEFNRSIDQLAIESTSFTSSLEKMP